ncbi:sortase [Nocardioides convexus]|uniref:sortase n=1 Tax=Nocardioides convexus TaxID=2712224 RepID=UPI0024181589|nr:sortase [Nocardioides convexus]
MTLAPTGPARTEVHSGEVDASPPPGIADRQIRVAGGRVLLGVSLVLGWVLLYLLVLSDFEQNHAQNVLYGEPTHPGSPKARHRRARRWTPARPSRCSRSPRSTSRTSSSWRAPARARLQDGPGHRPGTVLPGQQGVSVVAGRSVSYGRPFAHLPEVRRGARVVVTTAQGRFTYDVTGIRREGDPSPAPPGAGASRLTLITAAGKGSQVSLLHSSETVYVDAVLSSGAVAAGPRSGTDPRPESAGVPRGLRHARRARAEPAGCCWPRSRASPGPGPAGPTGPPGSRVRPRSWVRSGWPRRSEPACCPPSSSRAGLAMRDRGPREARAAVTVLLTLGSISTGLLKIGHPMLIPRKSASVAFVGLATAAGLTLTFTPAQADPAPQPQDVVATGSDIIQNSFNFLADGYHEPAGLQHGRQPLALRQLRLLRRRPGPQRLHRSAATRHDHRQRHDRRERREVHQAVGREACSTRPSACAPARTSSCAPPAAAPVDATRSSTTTRAGSTWAAAPTASRRTTRTRSRPSRAPRLYRVQIATDRQAHRRRRDHQRAGHAQRGRHPQDLHRAVHQVERRPGLHRPRARRHDHPADAALRRRHVEHLPRQRQAAEPGQQHLHRSQQPELVQRPAERPDRHRAAARGPAQERDRALPARALPHPEQGLLHAHLGRSEDQQLQHRGRPPHRGRRQRHQGCSTVTARPTTTPPRRRTAATSPTTR